MKSRYRPLHDAVVSVKHEELLKLLDDRAWRALTYLDDFTLAGAGAKDLAIAAGILLDKAQLLKGQPTQILTHAERAKMDELLPMVIKECQRRGIIVDGVKTESSIAPKDP